MSHNENDFEGLKLSSEPTKEYLDLINKVRKETAEKIAQDIVNVQPMGPEVGEAWMTLYENSKSEKQLMDEGYKPISEDTRLMWIKDDDSE